MAVRATPTLISVNKLKEHPDNPRMQPRQEVVDQIAAQLNGSMDAAHALIVRSNGSGYQIVSGHHRKLAADKAGLKKVPCWVREMSDEEAYMALVLYNAQSELTPLELGRHILHSKKSVAVYAKEACMSPTAVSDQKRAAKVAEAISPGRYDLNRKWSHLREIHAADVEYWPDLVDRLFEEDWTRDQTREAVQALREPEEEEVEEEKEEQYPARYVSLDAWKAMSTEEQDACFKRGKGEKVPRFNEQSTEDIEWAQWSWNPITGCLHDCPYCYARDIANQVRMREFYPYGFTPTLRPLSLLTPSKMKVPKAAQNDERYRNVFTGSMSDIFGRWVPAEWIEAVLDAVDNAPDWNFLFLTKFPNRMSEFHIPKNAWMGTSVDLQVRVAAAEKAFAKVKAKVKWLSVEPMLEPLKFKHLELFDWIVIGGASSSTKTPTWQPPFRWIEDLVAQADKAGTRVYFKTNLLGKRILELPYGKLPPEEELPEAFHYLGSKSKVNPNAVPEAA